MSKDRARIDIPEQQARKLREISEQQGMSFGYLVRRGLDLAIELYADAEVCPHDHPHTREWCGYDTCRES